MDPKTKASAANRGGAGPKRNPAAGQSPNGERVPGGARTQQSTVVSERRAEHKHNRQTSANKRLHSQQDKFAQ